MVGPRADGAPPGRPPGRRLRGEEWTRAVLDLVEQVPPGRVLTYGDVAELLGSGAARSVGRTMALHGAEVAWWRVVRADGTLHDPLVPRAAREHEREGTPRRPGGAVDLGRARWDAAGWDAARWDAAGRDAGGSGDAGRDDVAG